MYRDVRNDECDGQMIQDDQNQAENQDQIQNQDYTFFSIFECERTKINDHVNPKKNIYKCLFRRWWLADGIETYRMAFDRNITDRA